MEIVVEARGIKIKAEVDVTTFDLPHITLEDGSRLETNELARQLVQATLGMIVRIIAGNLKTGPLLGASFFLLNKGLVDIARQLIALAERAKNGEDPYEINREIFTRNTQADDPQGNRGDEPDLDDDVWGDLIRGLDLNY